MSSTTSASGVHVSKLGELVDRIETVVYGKREVVTMTVAGFLARGHVLLEDVPGTGKTTLARALAACAGGSFQRVQFTSDLLPGDVVGVSVYSQEKEGFRFLPGPIFCNVLLADELNRTSPRTQSALLECMSEGQVSVDGGTYKLPDPFFVIATQNPLEFEGTYPLPESQLDRFLMRLSLGYPGREHERRVLESGGAQETLGGLKQVMPLEDLQVLMRYVARVRFDDSLMSYLLNLVEATRKHGKLSLGASTRAAMGLHRAAQALALVEERSFCVPDDLKRLFLPVIAHRVVAAPLHNGSPEGVEEILAEILASVPVPE